MKETSSKTKNKDKEFLFTKMEINIQAYGEIIKDMDQDSQLKIMEIYMKENGKTISLMEKESINLKIMIFTKVIGQMARSKASELKSGQMKTFIMDSGIKTFKTEQDFSKKRMVISMKENFEKVNQKDAGF